MAAAPPTSAEKAAKLDPDLQFILSELGADLDTQALAYDNNFKTIRMFSVLGDTRQEVRAALRTWGIDITAGAEQVTRMAWLLSTWERCNRRIAERDRLEASRASASDGELLAPRKSFVQHGVLNRNRSISRRRWWQVWTVVGL